MPDEFQFVSRKFPIQDGWIREFTGRPRSEKDIVVFIQGMNGHPEKSWETLIDKLERIEVDPEIRTGG